MEFKEALKQRYLSGRGVSDVTTAKYDKEELKKIREAAHDNFMEARRLRKAKANQKAITARLKESERLEKKANEIEKLLNKK